MKRLMTVVGARPQFIKAATVSRLLRDGSFGLSEQLVHTGQHYDDSMSASFFRELDIPEPFANLHVGSGSHGAQTGAIMSGLEKLVAEERPDIILVYGDTNSTLAAALVAAKASIPLAHVEAGLRSFRPGMPEEVNRVVTDRLSQWLFCPTTTAVENLRKEGHSHDIHLVGDVMFDSFLHFKEANKADELLACLGVGAGKYVMATVHRAENTDDPARLSAILAALAEVARDCPVVLPLHPRTLGILQKLGWSGTPGIHVIDPQPYAVSIGLIDRACAVATDSGGLQKEAFFARTPCVTLRDETEWVETLQHGWNRLAPPESGLIVQAIQAAIAHTGAVHPDCFGDGNSARRIVEVLAAT